MEIGIGGSTANAGNNLIEGNYIGTDATGTVGFAASPNPYSTARDGISIGTVGNTIGGTTPAARNLVSANIGTFGGSYGIDVNASGPPGIDTYVQGNLIGTDRTGTLALGNESGGVIGVVGDPNEGSVIVGGPEAGAGNVISGNGGTGVASENGVVQGNFIGTDVTGTLAVGNNVGVEISGNVTLASNTIAFNASTGVSDTGGPLGIAGTGNLITRNSIFSNGGIQLILGGDLGLALNDPSPDSDGIQNYPVLSSVAVAGAGTQVQGVLDSKPSSSFRLEFFANSERDEYVLPGEFAGGQTFVGTIDVTTDANGHASFTANLPVLPSGQPFMTATATDVTDTGSGPLNNTSGFSPVAVLGGPSFVVTNTGDTGLGTLREAIYNANLTPGAHTITFAIPATDPRHFYYRNDGVAGQVSQADIAVTTATSDADIADIDPDWPHSWFSILPSHDLPEIVNTVTIDGYSQPGSVANTLPALGALNTVLKIELDGTNAPGEGLNLSIGTASGDSSNSRIDGLAINRFGGDGIELNNLDGNNVIAGNFIGTDVSGMIGLGNGGSGIYLSYEDGDTIGGTDPADFNLIAGNDTDGIELLEPVGTNITGNLFGAEPNLAYAFPSTGPAVLFTTTPRDGGTASNARTASFGSPQIAAAPKEPLTNFVNRNFFVGVLKSVFVEQVVQQFGEASRKTAEYTFEAKYAEAKAAPGFNQGHVATPTLLPQDTGEFAEIDLGDDGVTPNDPGDADGIQNYPVLTSAITTTATTVTGTLNSVSNTSFQIELYSNSLGPNYRAGEQSLGTVDVTTDANGNASFTFPSPISVPVGQFITALATRLDRDPCGHRDL